MRFRFFYFCLLVIFISCSPTRNLTYLSNIQPNERNLITNNAEIKIQPGDLLAISITSLSPESNAIFNGGVLPSVGTSGKVDGGSAQSKANEGYQVDKNGMVVFPLIGKIKFAGLTKEEAAKQLTEQLSKYAKEPIVDIRFLNFRITVIGEVNRPSSFNVPTEKINIFEAIGLAGDMTTFGKRENVLVIREQDGYRTTNRLNLLDKRVFNSPYFYLQQNDLVYIEADESKAALASVRRSNISLALSISTTVISIATLVLSQFL